jgi:hypothetical protein
MFQNLLSPLKARFDQLSPRSPSAAFPSVEEEDVQTPEDFARDVLVQLMRNSVENLKMADTQVVKGEVRPTVWMRRRYDADRALRSCRKFTAL